MERQASWEGATVLIHNGYSFCMAPFSHNDCDINKPALQHYWVSSYPFIILLNAYKNKQTIYILESNNSAYKQYFVTNFSPNKERWSAIFIVSLPSNTIVLIVLYNGIIILIIAKSKRCLKLVSTTAQKLSLTLCVLQCNFWCNFRFCKCPEKQWTLVNFHQCSLRMRQIIVLV